MKRLLLVPFLAMLCAFQASAQTIENKLSTSNQEWLDRDWPITDTLVFDFPNESKLLLYFNNREFSAEELAEEFEPLLRKATDFPEFTTIAYRLGENFSSTGLKHVKYQLEKKYVPYIDSLELTFPVGLDYTGGDFTPVVGFRALVNWRNFSLGGSITNTVYFPERIENNIKVNSNWFANAEFAWEFGNLERSRRNIFGVGYLINENRSQLFSGTTMQTYYNRKLSKNISIQVGVISTENFKTFYPTVGVRFW
ncbi:hypothetical protein LZF95_22080 [Algoriphagus sp. AGSA1]|uniref:hypothetical protein n=1 Tax=Algoriphagus sp. AGSA1 TaxID=2907213 RepID=UPI001F2E7D2D|nr:hypothetical protein [Algoriphagus sp. AGSA1]MCE7057386.1 hypothetical protein [Algoriphagus sp. AGSA1]